MQWGIQQGVLWRRFTAERTSKCVQVISWDQLTRSVWLYYLLGSLFIQSINNSLAYQCVKTPESECIIEKFRKKEVPKKGNSSATNPFTEKLQQVLKSWEQDLSWNAFTFSIPSLVQPVSTIMWVTLKNQGIFKSKFKRETLDRVENGETFQKPWGEMGCWFVFCGVVFVKLFWLFYQLFNFS